ncbi:MAG: D-alanyl-D-alanine carboxypeptidase family protein [Turicibacter sp.]
MKKMKLVVIVLMVMGMTMGSTQQVSAISSECGILVEQITGRVLFEQCAEEQKYIASITKIMTAILAIEEGELNEWVEISDNATRQVGSSLYVKAGDKLKLIDLVYGLMLRSGNDAAMAIAESVSGTEEAFVELMNEKAKILGMTNSVFQNPSGLDETTYNLSTAKDMATLMRYAMDNPIFREVVGTKSHKAKSSEENYYVWQNKHKLVTGYYEFAIGGKTGFTKMARRTLVTSAQKDGLELVVVTLNAGDDWNDHMGLFNYGFDQFEVKKVVKKGEVYVTDEKVKDKIFITEDVVVTMKKDGTEEVSTELSLYNQNSKSTDNQRGVLQVKLNGELIQEVPVYRQIEPKVESKSWFDKLMNWVTGSGDEK